jgi:acetoin utilization deacetylase AcuC-like enzyme
VPLEVGAVDEDYRLVFAEVVLPILGSKPDLVVASAGFDAHERDPLAGMRLTTRRLPR